MQFEVACPLEGKNIVQTFLWVLHWLCSQAGPPSMSILRPLELLQSRGRKQVRRRQTFWMVVTHFGQDDATSSLERGFLMTENPCFQQTKLSKLSHSGSHSYRLPQTLHRAYAHFDVCTLDSSWWVDFREGLKRVLILTGNLYFRQSKLLKLSCFRQSQVAVFCAAQTLQRVWRVLSAHCTQTAADAAKLYAPSMKQIKDVFLFDFGFLLINRFLLWSWFRPLGDSDTSG